MAFLNFRLQPGNELEKGGRTNPPVQAQDAEPERNCPNCHKDFPVSKILANDNVCTCGYHFRMGARARIKFITDKDSFCEMFQDITSKDIISFPGYESKLEKARAVSRENEGVICGTAKIGGCECCLFVMEPFFMMGSMGSAVGEKITLLFEYAEKNLLPVVGYTVSGGARMQEGLISLMQMAKTSGAVKRHSDKGLFYLDVLTDPTTGGVTASFAMEGDIILAEPGAVVGFAGARVVKQTTRKALPKGFQSAESLTEHGFVDAVVPRKAQKAVIAQLLKIHKRSERNE